MKNLSKLVFIGLALIGMLVMAGAQTFAWEYSIKGKNWSPIVAPLKPFTLTEVPLLKTIEIGPMFGTEAGTARPMLGFLAYKTGKLARQVDWVLGGTFRVVQNRPPSFGGIVIGATIRLN